MNNENTIMKKIIKEISSELNEKEIPELKKYLKRTFESLTKVLVKDLIENIEKKIDKEVRLQVEEYYDVKLKTEKDFINFFSFDSKNQNMFFYVKETHGKIKDGEGYVKEELEKKLNAQVFRIKDLTKKYPLCNIRIKQRLKRLYHEYYHEKWNKVGFPDFVVLLPNLEFFLVEVKNKLDGIRKDQISWGLNHPEIKILYYFLK